MVSARMNQSGITGKGERIILTVFILLITASFTAKAQTTIKGIVTDNSGEPLIGANIFIEGTFDGASTDLNGEYNLLTELKGEKVLIFSYIGFIDRKVHITLSGEEITQNIKLKLESNELNAVIITAGSFEASDKKKGVTLKPLDIVTTPSAEGDIYGALKTLPGAQTVGEDGRLFVRGGDSYESKTFIDGMLVQQPYTSKLPDIPARGRFSPFLFTGTLFSSGGYSAEYGQAMSSALILNTNALPEETLTNLSFMSLGGGAGHTKRWDNSSLSFNYDYVNLGAYHKIFNTNMEWDHSPTAHSGLITARKKIGDNGMIKFMSNLSQSHSSLSYPNYVDDGGNFFVDQENTNMYFNTIYTDRLPSDWNLKFGLSYTHDFDDKTYGQQKIDDGIDAAQVKLSLSKRLFNGFKLKFGADHIVHNHELKYKSTDLTTTQSFTLSNPALFTEAEIQLPAKLAARVGVRAEYSDMNKQTVLAPRLSIAYKLSDESQFSFAYGDFYQSPQDDIMLYNSRLNYEKAQHFILNYQYTKGNNTFRVEAYNKLYNKMVKYSEEYNPQSYYNGGDGHARGLDLFWKNTNDKTGLDFWVAYSYIDSERDYRDYPIKAQPTFISNHNLSVVAKKHVNAINTQFGMSYSVSSGRPFRNPTNSNFLEDRTDYYSNLSLNFSHLTHIKDHFTVIYFSVSNVLGRDNVFSYNYQKDKDGQYTAHAVGNDMTRFFVLGMFITIE